MEAFIWAVIGAGIMLAAIILGGILAIVVGLTDTLLREEKYGD